MNYTKLKQTRLDSGLSQVEVSQALGISQSHLSRIERGDKPVSDATLQKFADLYKVDPLSLLEPQQNKAQAPDQAAILQADKELPSGLRALAQDVSIYALKVTLAEWRMLRSIELPHEIDKDGYIQLLLALRGILNS